MRPYRTGDELGDAGRRLRLQDRDRVTVGRELEARVARARALGAGGAAAGRTLLGGEVLHRPEPGRTRPASLRRRPPWGLLSQPESAPQRGRLPKLPSRAGPREGVGKPRFCVRPPTSAGTRKSVADFDYVESRLGAEVSRHSEIRRGAEDKPWNMRAGPQSTRRRRQRATPSPLELLQSRSYLVLLAFRRDHRRAGGGGRVLFSRGFHQAAALRVRHPCRAISASKGQPVWWPISATLR